MAGHAQRVRELLATGRAVEANRLEGLVKVITTEQVEALLSQAAAGGGVDGMRLQTLEARLAEAESRAGIAEAEARRRNEQIAQLERQLGGVHVGEETNVTIGDPAEAKGFLDLVEVPDYPGLQGELAEVREDVDRLSARLGGAAGGEVRELATAIMKALGDEDEGEKPAEGGATAPNPGILALRARLDRIEGELQRDQDAAGILYDAMLDGRGTVSVVAELIAVTTRDVGYSGELRTLRRCLGLLAEMPLPE
jgi:hypothetical protein